MDEVCVLVWLCSFLSKETQKDCLDSNSRTADASELIDSRKQFWRWIQVQFLWNCHINNDKCKPEVSWTQLSLHSFIDIGPQLMDFRGMQHGLGLHLRVLRHLEVWNIWDVGRSRKKLAISISANCSPILELGMSQVKVRRLDTLFDEAQWYP